MGELSTYSHTHWKVSDNIASKWSSMKLDYYGVFSMSAFSCPLWTEVENQASNKSNEYFWLVHPKPWVVSQALFNTKEFLFSPILQTYDNRGLTEENTQLGKIFIIVYCKNPIGQKFGMDPVGIMLGSQLDLNFLPSLAPTNHPGVLVEISIFFFT